MRPVYTGEDSFLFWGMFTLLTLLVALVVFMVLIFTNKIEGEVTGKQFVEEHTTCAKACTTHPDCWEISVDSEPWYDNEICVSKSEYDSLAIGDYFKE